MYANLSIYIIKLIIIMPLSLKNELTIQELFKNIYLMSFFKIEWRHALESFTHTYFMN